MDSASARRADDGRKVTKELFRSVLEEELAKVRALANNGSTQRANFSTRSRRMTSLPNFSPCPAMINSVEFLSRARETACASGRSRKGAESEQNETDGERSALARDRAHLLARRCSALQGSVVLEHTLARRGAEKLWDLLQTEPFVAALGALTGNQAVQQARAGLKAIYLSGWQVAADANLAGQMYPDQSLYPANSVPAVVKRINQALQRADQIAHAEGESQHRLVCADRGRCGSRFRRTAQRFRINQSDDRSRRRRSSPRRSARERKEMRPHGRQSSRPQRAPRSRNLTAARLAADVSDVPTVIIARTDAGSAALLTSDVDERDHEFLSGERTAKGSSGCAQGSTRRSRVP